MALVSVTAASPELLNNCIIPSWGLFCPYTSVKHLSHRPWAEGLCLLSLVGLKRAYQCLEAKLEGFVVS